MSLLRQPYLQNVQQNRASILWTANGYVDGKVIAGGRTITATVQPVGNSYQYQADLRGLDDGTLYTYRVTMNGAAAGSGTFRTAGQGPFSFLVFGDSGENTPEQKAMIPMMNAEQDIGFLLHTGDIAYPQGTQALIDTNYFGLNAPLFGHLPVFPTPGNHEYMVDNAAPYFSAHALPGNNPHYYSYDWGNAHFVSIDSNILCTDAGDRMLEWLDADLAATRQFWKIVYMHHPPYPTGHHLGDVVCTAAHSSVNPIVEARGVQLVLAGHEHGYERSVPLASDQQTGEGLGTVYVITGGGGASLHDVSTCDKTVVALRANHYVRVDVDGGVLTLRAIGLDGGLLDRYVIRAKPSLSPHGVLSTGDYTEALAPGSLASIFGNNLAIEAQAASETPLPMEMGGVRARLDGVALPLFYVSPGQINTRIPIDAASGGVLEIVTPGGSVETQVKLQPTAPSILAVTYRDDVATRANAPSAGSYVVVYLTGLGQATGGVDVLLDRFRFRPSFAGPTPGSPGVYQVNFIVPAELGPSEYLMRIATADAASRMVTLIVQ